MYGCAVGSFCVEFVFVVEVDVEAVGVFVAVVAGALGATVLFAGVSAVFYGDDVIHFCVVGWDFAACPGAGGVSDDECSS